MKKAFGIFLVYSLLFWACATYQPPPPSLYVGNLPQSLETELSLDERILAEEAWKNLREGRGNKARKIIAKLGIESPFYNVGLGYAYYLTKEMQIAEDFFKAAQEDYPDMILSHLGLAQIYLDTGQEDKAFNELREVLKREPDHPWARPKYESLKTRKTRAALDEAKIQQDIGNTEASEAAFLKALYYSPLSTEAHLALASIYKGENKLQSALVHLKAASSNDPQNREILKNYGETLFQAEVLKKSLDVYEKLQDMWPEDQQIKERFETIKNRLGIFELPSQYDAISSSEAVTKEEISALIGVQFKDIIEEASGKPPIIIDISTSWASNFILKMTSLGILEVYPNHTFQPKKMITRAEMAEILIRLIGYLKNKGYRFIQQIPPERIRISDVSPDNYYHRPIILIISYDIMGLSQNRTFNPDLPVPGEKAEKFVKIILALVK